MATLTVIEIDPEMQLPREDAGFAVSFGLDEPALYIAEDDPTGEDPEFIEAVLLTPERRISLRIDRTEALAYVLKVMAKNAAAIDPAVLAMVMSPPAEPSPPPAEPPPATEPA